MLNSYLTWTIKPRNLSLVNAHLLFQINLMTKIEGANYIPKFQLYLLVIYMVVTLQGNLCSDGLSYMLKGTRGKTSSFPSRERLVQTDDNLGVNL